MKTSHKLQSDQIKDFRLKIRRAFSLLRKAGYEAKQNFMCCQSCGWAEPWNGDRVVFYHNQDNDNIPNGYVHIAWSGDGDEISNVFESVGLTVEWDGNEDRRIRVQYLSKDK